MALTDYRNVDWIETAKLSALRGVASAMVMTILGGAFGAFSGPGEGFGAAIQFLLLWTFAGSIGALFYIYMLRAIGATLGRAIGIVATVTTLLEYFVVVLVAIGDPLVHALDRQFPHLINVSGFKLFNLHPVIFVRNDPDGLA